MQWVKTMFKLCLLLSTGVAVAVLWIYCHGFLPAEFTGRGVPALMAGRAASVVTLLVLFSAPALPIARLFPRHSRWAGASVGWIPLALALGLAEQNGVTTPGPSSLGLVLVEGLACWVAIVLGASLAGAVAGSGRISKD